MAGKKNYLISNGYLQRLNDAYISSEFNAVQLGRILHRDRKAIYSYLHGDTTPDALTLARLCIALNISADWLLFGKDDFRFK
jgi:transcriptional regulator with XRE-family HTH domain